MITTENQSGLRKLILDAAAVDQLPVLDDGETVLLLDGTDVTVNVNALYDEGLLQTRAAVDGDRWDLTTAGRRARTRMVRLALDTALSDAIPLAGSKLHGLLVMVRGHLAEFDVDQVRAVVRSAIADRIGGAAAGQAILSATSDQPGTVLVHVNSGGNYLAAEQRLVTEGYTVTPGDKPECGCVLVVTRAER